MLRQIAEALKDWAWPFSVDRIDNVDGTPSTTRMFLLLTPLGGARFNVLRPDVPGSRHTHPWSGLSLVLAGGYREVRAHVTYDRTPGSLFFVPASTWHRTEALGASRLAVTLYAHGPRWRTADWMTEARARIAELEAERDVDSGYDALTEAIETLEAL